MKNFFKITNIDLTQSGAVLLHEVTQDYMGMYIVVEVVTKSGTNNSCAFSIGTNNSNYDNVISPQAIYYTDVNQGEFVTFNSASSKKKLLQNDELYLNVMSPFNGVFTVNIYGIGFDPDAIPSY